MAQSAEEAIAYQTWYAANSQNMQEKAVETAQAYLAQFPNGQYAAYLKSWLLESKLRAFGAAVQAKNTEEMIRAGREILKADPEHLGVYYSLAFNLRRFELSASPASFAHAKEAAEFAASGIKLIEAGKTIAGGQFDKNASLALLYQIQAMVATNAKENQKAIELFEKSLAADPGNAAIGTYNLLSLASLYREPYGSAVNAYQALPEADRQAAEPSAEVKAALEAMYASADPLINSWARFVALARARGVAADTEEQVLASVQAVYSARYGGDTSGLEPLIQKLQAEYAPKK
ncbi:MAG: hypothetical protein JJE39_04230 [Vicinamibacteria bacterium]|nr:hypothetical protein [Vicinamibacteria bacterium]